MLALAPKLVRGEAQVHLCVPGAQHSADLELAESLLDAREREQVARFKHAEDRLLYTVAHGLLRLVLARYIARPAHELELVYGAQGRPELADLGQQHDLRFSLSHTRGLAGCAVARVDAIGFDLEAARDIEHLDIAERFFSAPERQALAATSAGQLASHFYRIWTLKEAYLKARGFGLTVPLTSFTVEPLPEPQAHLAAQPVDDPARWALRSWSLDSHFAALALETITPLKLTTYEPHRLQSLG